MVNYSAKNWRNVSGSGGILTLFIGYIRSLLSAFRIFTGFDSTLDSSIKCNSEFFGPIMEDLMRSSVV